MFQQTGSGITIGGIFASTAGWKHPNSFLCFDRTSPGASPGSFWMGDPGNFRNLHWAAGASTGPAPSTLLDTLSWMPAFYSCFLCQGDPTRVFGLYLEFKIDYTKTFGPNNGSWTLVNNWSANIPAVFNVSSPGGSNFGYDGGTFAIVTPTVFSNGLTYALTRYIDFTTSLDEQRLSCLNPSSGLQFTGQAFPTNPYIPSIMPDGSIGGLRVLGGDANNINAQTEWSKQQVTGFDTSTPPHPQWAAAVLVQTPLTVAGDPYTSSSLNCSTRTPTTGGVVPIYYGQTDNFGAPSSPTGSNGPSGPNRDGRHFGGMSSTTGAWKFQCAPSTPQSKVALGLGSDLASPIPPNGATVGYGFGFPSTTCQSPLDGFFDRRKNLSNQTATVLTYNDQILYCMNGEGAGYILAGGETNIWRHYHEEGLMIGQFGPVQDRTIITSGPFAGQNPYCTNQVGMAGNDVAGGYAVVNGIGYLYHNDEGFKAGIHRWRVNGLDTLQYGSISVSWNGSVTTPPSDSTDMLSGLPKISTLPATSSGWTRSPTADIYNNLSVDWWSVTTNSIVYDPAVSPDINIAYACPASPITGSTPGDASVTRALPMITGPWHFSCNVMLPTAIATAGGWVAGGAGSYIRLELQDAAGRAIIRLELADTAVIINGVNFIGTPLGTNNDQYALANTISFPQLFAVTQSGTQFNVTYGITTQLMSKSDPAADASVSPPIFKVIFHFVAGSLNRPFTVNLSNVRFSDPPAPSSGTGTVTSVGTGTGLTGGTITTSGTISLQASLAPLASYTWPASVGTTGQVLTLGATPANLAWQTPAAGGSVSITAGNSSIVVAPSPLTGTGSIALNSTIQLGTPSSITGQMVLANAGSGLTTTIQAGNASTAQTYLLPTTVGTAGQALVLSTVSPNQLGWASAGGGGVTTVAAGTGISVASPTGPTATVSVNTAAALTWTATETFSTTIDLPHTTGAGVGVITKAGGAFIHEGGTNCTWIGVGTASPSTTASNCVGIGQSAMAGPNPSTGNVGIGTQALAAINGGTTNVGIGYQALQSLTTGANNTVIGGLALQTGTASTAVTAIGNSAGNSSTGNYNTFVGQAAGQFKTSGDSNTFVGQAAGYKFSSGANNLVLGSYQGIAAGDPISSCIILSDGVGNVPLDYAYTTATSGLVPIGAASKWTFRAPIRVPGGANNVLETTTSSATTGSTAVPAFTANTPATGTLVWRWIQFMDNGVQRYIPVLGV
jgi:hypothetical protein